MQTFAICDADHGDHMSEEANAMMIPTLMLHTKRCQDRYEHYRAKAILNKAEMQKKAIQPQNERSVENEQEAYSWRIATFDRSS